MLAVAVMLALSGAAASAQDRLATPQGPVILSVLGTLQRTNGENRADFDLDMLRALPATEIVTSTPWTEGVITFRGVPLSVLLDTLGVERGTLRATALNDYQVEIPVSDAWRGDPILAYARDGTVMGVRDKGPIWVMYPFDKSHSFRDEVTQARSIWQLRTIEVTE